MMAAEQACMVCGRKPAKLFQSQTQEWVCNVDPTHLAPDPVPDDKRCPEMRAGKRCPGILEPHTKVTNYYYCEDHVPRLGPTFGL